MLIGEPELVPPWESRCESHKSGQEWRLLPMHLSVSRPMLLAAVLATQAQTSSSRLLEILHKRARVLLPR